MRLFTLFRILSASLFSVHTVSAQFHLPIQKDASDFMHRTLLVQIFEEDHSILHKLQHAKHPKSGEDNQINVDNYKKMIASHNEWLRQSIDKYWKLNKKIEYKTKEEINHLLKDHTILREYAVLESGWKTELSFTSKESVPVDVFAFVGYVAESTDRGRAELRKSGSQKADYIFKIAFPTDAIYLSDFIWTVQQFNVQISNAVTDGQALERFRTLVRVPGVQRAGYPIIKEKILLLPQDAFQADKEAEIKTLYKYPFELVSSRFNEEAIEHQFAKYCYITMVWSDRLSNFAYFVVNGSEGIVLAELGTLAPGIEFVHHELRHKHKETDMGHPETYFKSNIGISMENINQLAKLIK